MDSEGPQTKKLKLEHENSNTERKSSDDNEDDKMTVDKARNGLDLSGFVNSEDIQKLREFKVLDEVKSNEEDSNAEDSDSSDDKSEGIPEEEIEKMLEENLPEDFKAGPKRKEKPYVTRTKIVLEEKGVNQFEVLPLDWIVVRHHSGMPIYFHRPSRVCTLSKPYFLGKGNIRRHDIPISAVPCFAYSRALEEEEKQKEIDRKVEEQIKTLSQKVSKPNIANQNKKYFTFIEKQGNFNSESNQKACPFGNLKNLVMNNLQNDNNEVKEQQNISMEVDNENSKEVELLEVFENDEMIGKGTTESTDKNEFTTTDSNEREAKTSEDVSMEAVEHSNDANQEAKSTDDVAVKVKTTEDVNMKKKTTEDVTLKTKNTEDVTLEVNFAEDVCVEAATEAKGEANQIAKTTNDETVETDSQNNEEANKNEGSEDTAVFDIPANRQPVILPGGEIMPAPRVESVNNSWKTQNLSPEQFHDYCKRLFKFKTIQVMQFNRWADRRKYAKAKKTMQYPTLPEGTKLITIPVQNSGQDNGGKGAKRDWVMNMNGGSYLSVFHEYVCRALQKQPVYEYKQLENASTPYQATVFIGGMQYGVGHGSSKRQAKYAAARASIRILIPEMREFLDSPAADSAVEPDFSFFDYINIEDPRIAEFCAAACEPSPHAILRTCLLRNFGASDRHIHTHTNKMACQEIELTMKVGKHSATVVCKNKKTAKQRASQAILQALHPYVRSWGSLLRLYGSKSVKSCKEKKMEEQQITLLQDKARENEPNYAVLDKLRNEMRKLRERDESVVPIGTLLVTDDLPTHSGSNLNNVDL